MMLDFIRTVNSPELIEAIVAGYNPSPDDLAFATECDLADPKTKAGRNTIRLMGMHCTPTEVSRYHALPIALVKAIVASDQEVE